MVTCSFVRVVYTPPQKPAGASRLRRVASRITAGPTAISARLGRSSVGREAAPAGAATIVSTDKQMTHRRTVTPPSVSHSSELRERYEHRGAERRCDARRCTGRREHEHALARSEQEHAG